jgi:glycosyltransferase involved in cell wall biosynthesis
VSAHVLVLLENESYPYDARVRQEATALREAGYRVTVASPTSDGLDTPDESIDGVRVLRYPAPPGGRGIVGYVREYAVSVLALHRLAGRAARAGPVDVVVVVTAPDLSILAALPLARRGAGVVLDHHDPSPELFRRKFGRRPLIERTLLALERFAIGRADVLVAVNETCAELVSARVGMRADRVFVVRQGPDPRRIHPVDERAELRRGRASLVVWTGSLSAHDRVAHLVEAADEIVNRRRRADVGFALVGDGDGWAAVAAELRRRGLGDAVALPGRVDDELLRAYIATADVCVSADVRGPMNDLATHTKVLDYMAMGRPVVQFPVTEMCRLCGDTAVYANDGDSVDLAERILALIAEPSRRHELGRAARRRVLDGLMWEAQIPAFLAAVRTAEEAGQCRRSTPRTP